MLRAVEQLLPRPLRPLVEPLISALIDEPAFEAAIGIQPAPEPLRAAVRNILLLRREVCKFISFFEEQALWEHPLYKTYKSYPDGYDRLKLGPEKVLAALEKRRASA
jgi:hypothetical protein